ncbi:MULTISPECIES: hypothetical protein [Rhodobacterales]|uniref:hypothetical protein n=1 Tax=Rhodobacterales TaxID=204455 RepID=UPI00215DBA5F|nr:MULTISPECIES: hypothetical protein [Rhodobacterales]MDO6588698.1 hypothetical protein [Yoonia sp. 1_MG-2023]
MAFHFKSLALAATVALGASGCVETSTASSGMNRNVLIVNNTGGTIWRFYGSRTSTNSWEEDILGSSILASGSSVNIDFNDGTGSCMFDLKAEFRDGSSVVRNNVNVCQVSTVTFK